LTPKTDKYSATDNKAILLKYKDGSVCSIEYFANGGKDLSKEYMEIHFDNKSIVLDDYRAVKGYNLKIVEIKSAIAEKGHLQEFEKVYEMISSNTGEMPIKLDELIETTKASFLISKLNE
jgi:hypothetical protein